MIVTPRQAIVSAVLFGFHGINLFKNLVSRELLRILENFHFSISISKHFDFTFHFSKKSESILISLCTSRKRVKAFFFHFALLEKEWKLFIFTFHFSNFKNPLSLVPEKARDGKARTNELEIGGNFSLYCEMGRMRSERMEKRIQFDFVLMASVSWEPYKSPSGT